MKIEARYWWKIPNFSLHWLRVLHKSKNIISCNFWTICCKDLCFIFFKMVENFQKDGGDTSPLSLWFRRPWICYIPEDISSHLELVNPRIPIAFAKSIVVALQLFGTFPLVEPFIEAATLIPLETPWKDLPWKNWVKNTIKRCILFFHMIWVWPKADYVDKWALMF